MRRLNPAVVVFHGRVLRGSYDARDLGTADGRHQSHRGADGLLIRVGSNGERENFVLEHGLAGSGFHSLPDLSGVSSRGEMKDLVRRLLPGTNKMSVANYSGQLWALRAHVSIGHLVVLPRKKTRQIAIGVVTRE